MRKDELAAPQSLPDPASTPVPVLCDACRAAGVAGVDQFAAIPDLMAFAPVPRRAHVNNWTAEHQRAFIAALAITGSPRIAARAIGRHQFGAEQLRKARGGTSFAAAWDAARDIARDREAYRVAANLAELAATREAELVRIGAEYYNSPPEPPPEAEMSEAEHHARQAAIRERLLLLRRFYLRTIADDETKRAAWETLCGPADWDRARAMERQDDEPFACLTDPHPDQAPFAMRDPGMILTVNAGLLNRDLGAPGPTDRLHHDFAQMERLRAEGISEDEVRAQMAIRDELLAKGWLEDVDGNLHEPDHDGGTGSP